LVREPLEEPREARTASRRREPAGPSPGGRAFPMRGRGDPGALPLLGVVALGGDRGRAGGRARGPCSLRGASHATGISRRCRAPTLHETTWPCRPERGCSSSSTSGAVVWSSGAPGPSRSTEMGDSRAERHLGAVVGVEDRDELLRVRSLPRQAARGPSTVIGTDRSAASRLVASRPTWMTAVAGVPREHGRRRSPLLCRASTRRGGSGAAVGAHRRCARAFSDQELGSYRPLRRTREMWHRTPVEPGGVPRTGAHRRRCQIAASVLDERGERGERGRICPPAPSSELV